MWDYLNSVKHRAGLFKQQNIWRYYICHHWMILYDVWLILYSYTIEYIGYDHHPWGELCSNLQQFLMGWDDGFCGFEHSNGLNMGYDVQYLYMYIYIYMYIPSYTILQANNNKRHIKICLEGNESLLLVLVVRQGCWWIYWYDWKPAKTERWSNFSSWWLDILQLCGPQNITPDCCFFFWQQERIPSGKLT